MTVRRAFLFAIALPLLLLTSARRAGAYSVLTHEAVVDLTWSDSIKPLLLARYPKLTPAELREARAYAYGGCVIQDLGYYPFGNPLFSDLLHYVRTGDFVRSLFRNAKNADDTAFAIGALTHYFGDTIGHPEAVNRAVAAEFPALAAKYGSNVNYAEGPHQHVRAEFAFDVNDIVQHRLAPEAYLNHIGFKVPVPLLATAFYETYGLHLGNVLGQHRPTMRGYRFSVRSLLPRVAYAETILYRKRMPVDNSSPELDEFNRQIAVVAAYDHWIGYRRHAGIGTYLLAGVIYILPKFGPLVDLKLHPPSAAAEQSYVVSMLNTVGALRNTLHAASRSGVIPNKDLDTGDVVYPGTYSLEDFAYADLLHEMTRTPASPIPFGIKRDLLAYFSDLSKVKYIQADPKRLAQVQADLSTLRTIPTREQEPDSPLLADEAAEAPAPTPAAAAQPVGAAQP
ncbi:MAG TPA: zinc dependent phospholipase C family protein [Acidobacteriaceae bacterium]|nr:zinc dependent phospholipase C family protein [Acidobacteriaceae bacterium]